MVSQVLSATEVVFFCLYLSRSTQYEGTTSALRAPPCLLANGRIEISVSDTVLMRITLPNAYKLPN